MSKPITERQRQVLRLIAEFIAEKGFAPTNRELAKRLGLGESSVTAISDHLRHLQAGGFVTREMHVARTLRLTDAGRAALARRHGPGPTGEAA